MSRRGLLAVTDAALAKAKRQREGKLGVFETPASYTFPELPDDIRTVLRGERETTGFYISAHPLEHMDLREGQGHATTTDVREGVVGKWITLVGIVSEAWQKPTRRGSVWGGCRLEDLEGVCQAFAFGDTALELADGRVLRVKGVIDSRDDQPALKITELKVLEEW